MLGDDMIKLLKVKVISHEVKEELGTVIKADKEGLFIQVNGGILSLITLQKSGRLPINYRDFINGYQNIKSLKFS
jgi:methionyl-tRNA formyltransferase